MKKGSEDRAGEVLRLAYVDGLGVRTIARRLSMSRKTVRRLLGRDRPKARPRPDPEPRSSILDAFTPVIRDLLRETPEMKAPAVLERLRPLGYTGGISILRDCVRKLRPGGQREAFLTLDFAPGKAVQVDWADFGFAIPGCPRRVSAFVMALCYSRYLYQRGIAFYGGTTVVDIFDNMRRWYRTRRTRSSTRASSSSPPRAASRPSRATRARGTRRVGSSGPSASSASASGRAGGSAISST
jgi:transposase